MAKVGLVAGAGALPLEFIRSAKARGEKVVVFALKEMADARVEEADKVYWVEVGEYKKYLFSLIGEGIRRLAFIGKVPKKAIYAKEKYDDEGASVMDGLRNKTDSAIFEEIARRLKMIGIEVVPPAEYLAHLLPEKGILNSVGAQRAVPLPLLKKIEDEITYGHAIASKIADMDIGQTIIIKDKAVVAVEAMEGTDNVIDRAASIAGAGCVMIKVSRPNQDMRWDVPTVGADTMKKLAKNKFKALAIESGKMFLAEREKFLLLADEAGIVVKVL